MQNLSWGTQAEALQTHMATAGTVLHAEVLTRSDGKSTGAAVVQFATADEAANAVCSLQGLELDGRVLQVV